MFQLLPEIMPMIMLMMKWRISILITAQYIHGSLVKVQAQVADPARQRCCEADLIGTAELPLDKEQKAVRLVSSCSSMEMIPGGISPLTFKIPARLTEQENVQGRTLCP